MNHLLDIYLRDISRYPQLSPQEELTLATRARQGDADAREQLIHANLSLVVRVAKVYMPPCDEILDLIQEGNIGLIKAVDMFDPAKGNRLSTLAFYWINKHIQRFLNHEPDDLVSLDMELTDSHEYLLLSDTIADQGTILGDPTIKNIQTQLENQEVQQQLVRMLDTLPDNDKQVLQLLFGINGCPQMNRMQVAKVIGVSADQVCRIKTRALKRLKKAMT